MWRVALTALGLALAACDESIISFSAPSAAYYVLVDSSGSYYYTRGSNFSHTKNALRSVRPIVNDLRPNDRFALAEIQSCSFNDAAVLIDETMPETESELFSRREPLRTRLDYVQRSIRATNRTDIRGAILGASLAMRSSSPDARRFLIIFSDLEEDRAADCSAPIDDQIDLAGIDVLYVNVKRLAQDQRNPAGYLARRRGWVDWAMARNARSADVVEDGDGLRARLVSLRTSPLPPPRALPTPRHEEMSAASRAPTAAARPSLLSESEMKEAPRGGEPALRDISGTPPQASVPVVPLARPLPPISHPNWLQRPSSAELRRLYPARELAAEREGLVVLECIVSADGVVNCDIVSESPANRGFGDAALRVAARYRMAEHDNEGIPTAGRQYRMTIPFRLSER